MGDSKAQQRVRLNNGTNDFGFVVGNPFFVRLSDGTDSLAINANGNLGSVIYTPNGDSAMDETNDAVRVNIVAGSSSATEFAEDSAHTTGDNGVAALVVRKDTPGSNVSADGDYATLLQDSNGRLYVNIHDGGNSITVDGTVAATQSGTWNIGTLTTITNDVNIADGGNVISVDDAAGSLTIDNSTLSVVGGGTEATALRVTIANDSTGVLSIDDNGASITVDGSVTVTATQLDIDDLNLTDDAVRISGNTSANSETNPIFVKNVDTVISGEEIQNYDTSASIATDATDNHDYTVAGTTFMLKSIIVAASGAMKCELQTGPVASLTTKAVIFTSAANPTKQITFDPPIEVPSTSTGTIRIIRRNDDNQAMDVYSTIIGFDL